MTEVKKRKVHTAKFKAEVGLEAVRGVKTLNEIALLYGVHPVMVSQWKKEILTCADSLFEIKRGPRAGQGARASEPHSEATAMPGSDPR